MLNISNDDHCGRLMKNIYDTLKSIVSEKKFYAGIESKETINAFIKLITSVLDVCNAEVSIMAVRCLKFLVTKLRKDYFKEYCNIIYGTILRILSYKYFN